MIDFLLGDKIPFGEVASLLSRTLNISLDEVLVVSDTEMNAAREGAYSSIGCLCVYSYISGDAKILLQIYRYDMPDEDFLERLVLECRRSRTKVYVPIGIYDDWLHVNGEGEVRTVRQVESNYESCFRFLD